MLHELSCRSSIGWRCGARRPRYMLVTVISLREDPSKLHQACYKAYECILPNFFMYAPTSSSPLPSPPTYLRIEVVMWPISNCTLYTHEDEDTDRARTGDMSGAGSETKSSIHSHPRAHTHTHTHTNTHSLFLSHTHTYVYRGLGHLLISRLAAACESEESDGKRVVRQTMFAIAVSSNCSQSLKT